MTRRLPMGYGFAAWIGLVVASCFALSSAQAQAQEPATNTANQWLDQAWKRKAAGDLDGAATAFDEAKKAGADAQRVETELGYLEAQRGNKGSAAEHFDKAAEGPDPQMAEAARKELKYLPQRYWGDLYGEAWGWTRLTDPKTRDLVPTLRIRGLYRPWLEHDFHLYVFAQGTRDTASTDAATLGAPILYADNHAMLGAGALMRLWQGRLSLFAQAGPAIALIDDNKSRVKFDARAGAALGLDNGKCRPEPADGIQFDGQLCLELYGEAVWVSRFDNNVIGMLRPRALFGLAVTGPVAWQPYVEARGMQDINGDYYNNRIEGGVGHRWRLLQPVGADLLVGIHAGSFTGRENVDKIPGQLSYVELRLLAATYFQF